jgi:hypothetical protein
MPWVTPERSEERLGCYERSKTKAQDVALVLLESIEAPRLREKFSALLLTLNDGMYIIGPAT